MRLSKQQIEIIKAGTAEKALAARIVL